MIIKIELEANRMNDFFNWYIKTEKEKGQLITPSIAAKLLGISTQHLNRIIELGRIERIKFENKTFLSRKEIENEIERRETAIKKLGPGAERIVKLINVDKLPEEILAKWLKEATEKNRIKDLDVFIKEKYNAWENDNPKHKFSPQPNKMYLIAITQDFRDENKYSFSKIIKDEYKYDFQ